MNQLKVLSMSYYLPHTFIPPKNSLKETVTVQPSLYHAHRQRFFFIYKKILFKKKRRKKRGKEKHQ